jgi:hypothetical protein
MGFVGTANGAEVVDDMLQMIAQQVGICNGRGYHLGKEFKDRLIRRRIVWQSRVGGAFPLSRYGSVRQALAAFQNRGVSPWWLTANRAKTCNHGLSQFVNLGSRRRFVFSMRSHEVLPCTCVVK